MHLSARPLFGSHALQTDQDMGQLTHCGGGVAALMMASNANKILNGLGSTRSSSRHHVIGFLDGNRFGPVTASRDAASRSVRPLMSEFSWLRASSDGRLASRLRDASGDASCPRSTFLQSPGGRLSALQSVFDRTTGRSG